MSKAGSQAQDRRDKRARETPWFSDLSEGTGSASGLDAELRSALAFVTRDRACEQATAVRLRNKEAREKAHREREEAAAQARKAVARNTAWIVVWWALAVFGIVIALDQTTYSNNSSSLVLLAIVVGVIIGEASFNLNRSNAHSGGTGALATRRTLLAAVPGLIFGIGVSATTDDLAPATIGPTVVIGCGVGILAQLVRAHSETDSLLAAPASRDLATRFAHRMRVPLLIEASLVVYLAVGQLVPGSGPRLQATTWGAFSRWMFTDKWEGVFKGARFLDWRDASGPAVVMWGLVLVLVAAAVLWTWARGAAGAPLWPDPAVRTRVNRGLLGAVLMGIAAIGLQLPFLVPVAGVIIVIAIGVAGIALVIALLLALLDT